MNVPLLSGLRFFSNLKQLETGPGPQGASVENSADRKKKHRIEGELVRKTSFMGLEMRNSFGVKDRIIFCMTKTDLKKIMIF